MLVGGLWHFLTKPMDPLNQFEGLMVMASIVIIVGSLWFEPPWRHHGDPDPTREWVRRQLKRPFVKPSRKELRSDDEH